MVFKILFMYEKQNKMLSVSSSSKVFFLSFFFLSFFFFFLSIATDDPWGCHHDNRAYMCFYLKVFILLKIRKFRSIFIVYYVVSISSPYLFHLSFKKRGTSVNFLFIFFSKDSWVKILWSLLSGIAALLPQSFTFKMADDEKNIYKQRSRPALSFPPH